MTGTTFSSNQATAKDEMQNSSYNTMMYCPVIRASEGDHTEHTKGRSDYGINRYFLNDSNDFTMNNLSGKTEPFIMPMNSTGNPSVWRTDDSSQSHNAYHVYGGNALALYLDGHVNSLGMTYSFSLSALINDQNNFE